MRENDFGTTGFRVSEIGFGGSRLGGVFAQKSDRNGAVGVLQRALDAGITFYDTADMYAQGESERLIGTAFRKRRGDVVIASKGGYTLPGRRKLIARVKPLVRPLARALGLTRAKLPAGVAGALAQNFSPEYLTNALDASLRRLQTNYVDLYQLHSPPESMLTDGALDAALGALESLKGQGKLRAYGIATESVEQAKLSLKLPGISSVQLGFGLLDLEALDGVLADAGALGLGIIARGCFGGGLLKESLTDTELQELTPKWPRIVELRRISERMNRPLLETAVQFCLAAPSISVTLLGMRTDDHLSANLKYAQAPPLTPEEFQTLRQIA